MSAKVEPLQGAAGDSNAKAAALSSQMKWRLTVLFVVICLIGLVGGLYAAVFNDDDGATKSLLSTQLEVESANFALLSIADGATTHEYSKVNDDLIQPVSTYDESAQTEIIDTMESWLKSYQASLGIEASLPGIFSASSHFKLELETRKTLHSNKISAKTSIFAKTDRATITIDKFLASEGAQNLKLRLQNLTDEASHWNLFRTYGTHYLCYFERGGKLIQSAELKTSEISQQEKQDLQIDLSSSFAFDMFSAGSSASFHYHNEKNYKKHLSDSSLKLHAIGGDPTHIVGLDHDKSKSKEAFSRWLGSVAGRPAVISEKYCPLGDLFRDRGEFAREIDFNNYLRSFLMSCPSSDSTFSCSGNGSCDFSSRKCICLDGFQGDDCIPSKVCDNATRYMAQVGDVALRHPNPDITAYFDNCKTSGMGECGDVAADAFCIAKGHPNGFASKSEKRAFVDTTTMDGTFKEKKNCKIGERCISHCHKISVHHHRHEDIMAPCNFVYNWIECKSDQGSVDCNPE